MADLGHPTARFLGRVSALGRSFFSSVNNVSDVAVSLEAFQGSAPTTAGIRAEMLVRRIGGVLRLSGSLAPVNCHRNPQFRLRHTLPCRLQGQEEAETTRSRSPHAAEQFAEINEISRGGVRRRSPSTRAVRTRRRSRHPRRLGRRHRVAAIEVRQQLHRGATTGPSNASCGRCSRSRTFGVLAHRSPASRRMHMIKKVQLDGLKDGALSPADQFCSLAFRSPAGPRLFSCRQHYRYRTCDHGSVGHRSTPMITHPR